MEGEFSWKIYVRIELSECRKEGGQCRIITEGQGGGDSGKIKSG